MKSAIGTTPPGTSNERQAAAWVRDMFSDVAPHYDFLNHLLSFNVDRGWRKALCDTLTPVLARPDAKVLDLCCGTGDVLVDLEAVAAARVYGADFCHPMLVSAQQKTRGRERESLLFEADALQLPIPDEGFDAISIAFGFRNLASYPGGLAELRRILRPGGMLAILEFSHPPGVWMKAAYWFYLRLLLPLVGGLLSGSRSAYTYLPDSIEKFPAAPALLSLLNEAGFNKTRYSLLTGGIAALHVGVKG